MGVLPIPRLLLMSQRPKANDRPAKSPKGEKQVVYHSERFRDGKRQMFLDLKEGTDGPYLCISEVKGGNRTRVFLNARALNRLYTALCGIIDVAEDKKFIQPLTESDHARPD